MLTVYLYYATCFHVDDYYFLINKCPPHPPKRCLHPKPQNLWIWNLTWHRG